ncbi:MAG: hypothetical protein R3B72_46205 [Polyangiaceae bacterium]
MLSRRLLLAAGSATTLHAVTTAAGALLGGCEQSTTGGRVTYESTASSDLTRGESFDNAFGWSISLDEAWLSIAYLRYVEGTPIAMAPSTLPQRFARLLVPQASAHPGHYDEGGTLGEMRTPQLLDLLADPIVLGSEAGVTGNARSALVRFQADASLDAGAPGAVALVHGVATSGSESRTFTALTTAEELVHSSTGAPEVIGCPLDGGPIDQDGTIAMEVQLRIWLEQVDFSLVPAGTTDDELLALEPGTPPHNAFVRGVQKASAYLFHYSPS